MDTVLCYQGNFQQVQAEQSQSVHVYRYKVKIINQKKKSDSILLNWHHMSVRFESVSELKLKLMDDFKDFVPSTPDFQVGYIEGSSKQHWIISREDLDAMYESVRGKSDILLWCDKKEIEGQTSRKRKGSEANAPASKCKCDEREDEILEMVDRLKEKHSTKYTAPQYRLWAKFIQSKRHDSYDKPPKVGLITGEPDTRQHTRKDSTVSEAMVGAANALAKALNNSPKSRSISKPTSSQGISPNSHANLRRKHLEDMKMLHSMYEDGVLTTDEYQEQKENILKSLREL